MGTFPKDSENGFFLHVPSNMVEVIRTSYNNQDDRSQSFNDIMTHFEIDVDRQFHTFMERLFSKHSLDYNKYVLDSPKVMYDAKPV